MNTISDFENITNLTTTRTTLTQGPNTQSTDNDDLKIILSYAIPLSCLTIILVIVTILIIHYRQRIYHRWNTFKRMRNLDPKFRHSTGIRRDSEFNSYDQDDINVITINDDNFSIKDQEYRLTTIL